MSIPQKINGLLRWSQENPRGLSLTARLLHHAFGLRQRLPGRDGFLLIFTGAIGSLVSFSPAIRALARQHAQTHIGVMVKGAGGGAILTACPHVDQIVEFIVNEDTRHKWWRILRVLSRMMWRPRYTTAILAMGTGWMPKYRIWGLLLLYATGAKHRIALREECRPWWDAPDTIKGLPLATKVITTSRPQRTERFLELFHKAGLIHTPVRTDTEVWTSHDDIREAVRLTNCATHRRGESPRVLVFPGVGSGVGKLWPTGRYVGVINDLMATHHACVYLDGMPRDNRMCQAMAALTSCCGNLAGRHSVGVLCALIRRADLVIAADSAPIHIAAATRTRAIAIFGPTNPQVWAPRSPYLTILRTSACPPCEDPYVCPRQSSFACTSDVRTSDVVQACRAILLGATPKHD